MRAGVFAARAKRECPFSGRTVLAIRAQPAQAIREWPEMIAMRAPQARAQQGYMPQARMIRAQPVWPEEIEV